MLRTLAAAAALLAFVPSRAAASTPFEVFPEPERVFRRLIADPRHIQLSASYYGLDGRHRSDVALGHSWEIGRAHV